MGKTNKQISIPTPRTNNKDWRDKSWDTIIDANTLSQYKETAKLFQLQQHKGKKSHVFRVFTKATDHYAKKGYVIGRGDKEKMASTLKILHTAFSSFQEGKYPSEETVPYGNDLEKTYVLSLCAEIYMLTHFNRQYPNDYRHWHKAIYDSARSAKRNGDVVYHNGKLFYVKDGQPNEEAIGLQILRPTDFGVANHHGIYVGGGEVIEYNMPPGGKGKGDSQIQKVPLDSFIKKNLVKPNGKFQYIQWPWSFTPEVTVEIAHKLLGAGKDKYHLTGVNCETFATFCKIGILGTEQIQRGVPIFNGRPSFLEKKLFVDKLFYPKGRPSTFPFGSEYVRGGILREGSKNAPSPVRLPLIPDSWYPEDDALNSGEAKKSEHCLKTLDLSHLEEYALSFPNNRNDKNHINNIRSLEIIRGKNNQPLGAVLSVSYPHKPNTGANPPGAYDPNDMRWCQYVTYFYDLAENGRLLSKYGNVEQSLRLKKGRILLIHSSHGYNRLKIEIYSPSSEGQNKYLCIAPPARDESKGNPTWGIEDLAELPDGRLLIIYNYVDDDRNRSLRGIIQSVDGDCITDRHQLERFSPGFQLERSEFKACASFNNERFIVLKSNEVGIDFLEFRYNSNAAISKVIPLPSSADTGTYSRIVDVFGAFVVLQGSQGIFIWDSDNPDNSFQVANEAATEIKDVRRVSSAHIAYRIFNKEQQLSFYIVLNVQTKKIEEEFPIGNEHFYLLDYAKNFDSLCYIRFDEKTALTTLIKIPYPTVSNTLPSSNSSNISDEESDTSVSSTTLAKNLYPTISNILPSSDSSDISDEESDASVSSIDSSDITTASETTWLQQHKSAITTSAIALLAAGVGIWAVKKYCDDGDKPNMPPQPGTSL